MTEQSSFKGFFKEYMLYRIKAQKMNFILCCILNILTLPLFVTAQRKGFEDEFSQFYVFGAYFSMLCGIFLITLAAVGAVFSFEYCNNKTLTDTVGSLPLTYKQRFWGDFISGYIANVAPVIPFALISAVYAGADNGFKEHCEWYAHNIGAMRFMLCMAVSLIIALTFTYLFAVLVATSCGRVVQSVLFTIFGTGALAGTVAGLAGVFAAGMLGVDPAEYMFKAVRFVPPFGTVIDLTHGISFLREGSFEAYNGEWWNTDTGIGGIFAAANVPNIAVYVILGAGITLGAYYTGKRRKPERTGSAFAVRPVFYVISSLFGTAAVFLMSVMLVDRYNSFGEKLLMAAGFGGLMCVVSVVMYLPKLKRLPECILCGMLSVGLSVGIVALLRGTCSFGAAYLPENAKEIEYIKVNNEFSMVDKSDIKQYVKNINNDLRYGRYTLAYGTSFNYSVEYQTSDGRVIKRSYTNSVQNMKNSERKLAGYGRYFFEGMFKHDDRDWSCRIIENNREYDIPGEKAAEFLDTLSKEAEEKYDPNAKTYASVDFSGHGPKRTFYIGENLEKTVVLLEQIKKEADPSEIVLMISYDIYDTDDVRSLCVKIRNKDMDNAIVTELFGLLKAADGTGNRDGSFSVNYPYDPYGDGFRYFISKENSKRVLEIMTELAFEAPE